MSAMEIHMVTAADSPEFSLLLWALRHSAAVGLDAEWKPWRSRRPDSSDQVGGAIGDPPAGASEVGGDSAGSPRRSLASVTLLQIACRVVRRELPAPVTIGDRPVFLVDLLAVPVAALWEPLREMFVSPAVIKLGFRFKQDLIYLSSTFSSKGCDAGFDEVDPFLDITSIYNYLKGHISGKRNPKDIASLATICKEILNVSLSKDLQCSDWSCRPLSEEQILYAAADAYYLLEIFSIFEQKLRGEGNIQLSPSLKDSTIISLKVMETNTSDYHNSDVSGMVTSSVSTYNLAAIPSSSTLSELNLQLDGCLLYISSKYNEKILLKESDKQPKSSRRKTRQSSASSKWQRQLTCSGDWQGPPAWDLSLGGDGCPKFLCDVMVEGLAKHLRCVGIDAATSTQKRPDPRQLLDKAYKEKRVLLTRDIKLLKYQYFENQVYKVKSLLKNDQLLEVIETFQLKISEEKLMSRCTKCNGNFIQKPLTTEEAVDAAKGFQIIPNCLFNRNLEFWQCTDCKQLYWEGTQYHNAVQKFVAVCKLND